MTELGHLLALFDAACDLPLGNVSVSLHCYEGVIVKALKLWAADRGVEVKMTTLTHERGDADDYAWDKYEVNGRWGSIVVHDAQSRRSLPRTNLSPESCGGTLCDDLSCTWRPSDGVQS